LKVSAAGEGRRRAASGGGAIGGNGERWERGTGDKAGCGSLSLGVWRGGGEVALSDEGGR
jgi:hypothetical protein